MRKLLVLGVLALVVSAPVYAQQNNTDSLYNNKSTPARKVAPWWVDRFQLGAGFFIPVNSTVIQVGNASNSTTIDLEKDLGFQTDKSTFMVTFDWRISRRSKLSFTYLSLSRTASKVIDKDITFDDTTYHANATIASSFTTNIYELSYGYAFISQPTYEFGVMVGAHVIAGDMSMGVSNANGTVSGTQEFKMTTPLPDLGIWGGVAFSNKLAFNGSIGWLNVATSGVDVNILAFNLDLRYRIARQLDLRAGYSGLSFDLNVDVDKVNGYLKWKYNGPSFGVSYAFGKKNWD